MENRSCENSWQKEKGGERHENEENWRKVNSTFGLEQWFSNFALVEACRSLSRMEWKPLNANMITFLLIQRKLN